MGNIVIEKTQPIKYNVGATICRMSVDNIGQMSIKEAKFDIIRMETIFPDTKWMMDFSQFLEEPDNWDNPKPSELTKGNCWVVLNLC